MHKVGDTFPFNYFKEEFEDTKGVIRIRISKKNRQHNGQKKKYKRTNNLCFINIVREILWRSL
jgi:hypothetical protein